MGRSWKKVEVHVRESLDCLEETGRNTDIKGDSSEVLNKNEEHILET